MAGRHVATGGARTPEELETLFEDALVIGDRAALTRLFEAGATLAAGDERPARGEAIPRLALTTWSGERTYVAHPRRVVVARDIALVVAEWSVNVARRDRDGAWRYTIVVQAVADGSERSEE